ncbi:MAG: hypothetical protein ACXVWZ_07395 [Nocardioides sp.]
MLRRLAAVVAAGSAAMLALAGPVHASAGADGRLVSDFPVLGTPHVMDGSVLGIARIGDEIVAVGSFTRVSPAGTYRRTSDDLTRRGIFAFDARTGAIDRSFAVSLRGGPATSVDTDGTSLYVGGDFTSVDGQTRHRRLVKLTPSGSVVDGFRATAPAEVDTLVVRGTRVYVGGAFTSISHRRHPVTRRGLAAVSTRDGSVLSSVRVPFRGVYTSRFGRTTVRRIDLTADGRRLVAIGNFTTVGGLPRVQVAVLDTGGRRAHVTAWRTARFDARHNHCSRHIGSFVRDVDLAPTGGWFVVATTGGYGGGIAARTLCDTTSRWSTRSGRGPVWVDYTGGDTTTAVEVASGAVYVGGHMRWENNPYRGDHAGPGAVPRQGLAALDPVTGLPLSWNPGRDRGVGVGAFLTTADGLWVGSDTTLLAEQRRGRIALLPWDGGRSIPHVDPARLPTDLYAAPRRSPGVLRERPVDATGAPSGPARRVGTGLDWSEVRGACYVDGEVYYGWAAGGLYRRTFDVGTGRLGPRHRVGTHGLAFPASRLTGLFYEPVTHRLYYTVAGDERLRYRDVSVESHVLGAVEQVADRQGVGFAHVAGMTLVGGRIVYGSDDGALRSVAFRGGRVVGTPHGLSGDGTWHTRALFVPDD